MEIKSQSSKLIVVGVLIVGVVILVNKMRGDDNKSVALDVKVPTLSADGVLGRKLFDDNCVVCHGKDAGGSDQGPPLIHKIYEPSHHGDQAFVLAAKLGVRAHHWKFGNMPPQPQVSDTDVLKIVSYVREVQRANGID